MVIEADMKGCGSMWTVTVVSFKNRRISFNYESEVVDPRPPAAAAEEGCEEKLESVCRSFVDQLQSPAGEKSWIKVQFVDS